LDRALFVVGIQDSHLPSGIYLPEWVHPNE
jgi:hypothetical protein